MLLLILKFFIKKIDSFDFKVARYQKYQKFFKYEDTYRKILHLKKYEKKLNNQIIVLRVHRHTDEILYESGSSKASYLMENELNKTDIEFNYFNTIFDETKNLVFAFLNILNIINIFYDLSLKNKFCINSKILIDTPGPNGFSLLILKLFFPRIIVIRFSHNFELFHRFEKFKNRNKIQAKKKGKQQEKKKLREIVNLIRSALSESFSVIQSDKLASISIVDKKLYEKYYFKKTIILPYHLTTDVAHNKNFNNKINTFKDIDLLILRNNKKSDNTFLKKLDSEILNSATKSNIIALESQINFKNIQNVLDYDFSNLVTRAKGIVILDEFGYGFKTKFLECAFSAPIYISERYLQHFQKYNFAYDKNILLLCSQNQIINTINNNFNKWSYEDINNYNNTNQKLFKNNLIKFLR